MMFTNLASPFVTMSFLGLFSAWFLGLGDKINVFRLSHSAFRMMVFCGQPQRTFVATV